MSDTHTASYSGVTLKRQELLDRVAPVLEENGVAFLNSVRGFDWDEPSKTFGPDHDRDIEGVDSLQDACTLSSEWKCACFDLRFVQWSIEMFSFESATDSGLGQHIAMDFPNSLYKLAMKDPSISERWTTFLSDIGLALGEAAMICGPDVPLRPATEQRLLARFEHFVKNFQPASYSVHTALYPSRLLTEQTRRESAAAGFSERDVAEDYRLLTLLPHEKDS